MATSEHVPVPRGSPWKLWARRLLILNGLSLVVGLGAAWFLLSSLDAPWLKTRLQAEVKQASGLELEWKTARLTGSGLSLEDVHVRSPEPLRGTAPDFVHVDRLEGTWSPGRLARGGRPLLDTLVIEGVQVVLVDDAQRGSTLDLLFPAAPAAPATPTGPGLSGTLQALFSSAPLVGTARVEGVGAAWKKVDHGAVIDSASAEGLALRLEGWKAKLTAAPLRLAVKGHTAALRLAVDAAASAKGLTLHGEGDVDQQDFEPALQLAQLLRLDARSTFDPKAHRLEVALTSARLLDGAAAATAELQRFDDGALLIDTAKVELDLVRLTTDAAALGLPLSAASGTAEVRAHAVRALPRVALDPTGELSVHAQLAGLDYRPATRLARATVDLRLAQPKDKPQGLTFSAELDALNLEAASVQTLRLKGTGAEDPKGWRGEATLALSTLVAAAGARIASLELSAHGSELGFSDGVDPLQGKVGAKATLEGVRFANASVQAALEKLHLTVGATIEGHPPYAATASAEGQLHLAGPDSHTWYEGPLQLEASARDLRPASQSGAVTLRVSAGELELTADASRTPGAAHLEGTLEAPSLALLAPVVTLPPGWRASWGHTSASLTTRVDAESLAAAQPRFSHLTTLLLTGFEASTPQGQVLVPELKLNLDGRGSTSAQTGTLALTCSRCVVGAVDLGDEGLTAAFDVDRLAPRVRLQLDAKGNGPSVRGFVTLQSARPARGLDLEARLQVGKLAALAPLLHGSAAGRVDLTTLGGKLHAHGTVELEHPAETVRGALEAELSGLTWGEGERSVEVPSATLTAKLEQDPQGPRLAATFGSPHLEVAIEEHTATLSGLAIELHGQRSRTSSEASGTLTLSLAKVAQDWAAAYPVGGVKVSASGTRDATGLLSLSRSTVVNGAAGTSLWIEGAFAPDPTHPKITGQAQVAQDLALAWTDPKQFEGAGQAILKVALHSGDLHALHTSGSLVLDKADLHLAGAVAEGVEGELPFAIDLISDAKGLHPLRTARPNPYALLRFQDQHPLLKDQSYLTMRKLTTSVGTFAPFAANVQLGQSVLYVSQLEVGLLDGQITGELLVDMNEKDPRVRANVRATGIRSAEGDVFSGNAALALSLRDHSVDGRAEVLQISQRQLQALLDLSDPHHTSASTNRIRSVLAIGYPDRLHILFNHGFASARITFGGAASLVQLDELRGIPVESLVDRYLFTSDDDNPEGT